PPACTSFPYTTLFRSRMVSGRVALRTCNLGESARVPERSDRHGLHRGLGLSLMNGRRRTSTRQLLALLAVMTLSACGQQSSEPTSSTPTPPAPSSAAPTPSPSPTPTQELVTWYDNAMVSHLFFHSLVVDPKRAFDNDAEAPGYLDYMVTVDEFDEILKQLYERDYILISPHDLYEV